MVYNLLRPIYPDDICNQLLNSSEILHSQRIKKQTY